MEYAGTVANLMTHSKRRHSLAVRQSAPVSLLHLQLTGAPAMEKNVKIFLQAAALKAALKSFTKATEHANAHSKELLSHGCYDGHETVI